MGRVYLANAFSLNMLPLSEEQVAQLCVARENAEKWLEGLHYHLKTVGVDCAIGHAGTARLVRYLLEMFAIVDEPAGLVCERKMITLEPHDVVYVIQPRVRLPEGRILDYDEIVQLLRQDKLAFYAVYYGPC